MFVKEICNEGFTALAYFTLKYSMYFDNHSSIRAMRRLFEERERGLD